MGRKPAGEKAMTTAQRMKKYRDGFPAQKKEEIRRIDRNKHAIRRQKIKSNVTAYNAMLQTDRARKAKNVAASPSSSTTSANVSEEGTPRRSSIRLSSHFNMKATKARSIKKATLGLPLHRRQRLEVLKSIFETDIEATPRKARLQISSPEILEVDGLH